MKALLLRHRKTLAYVLLALAIALSLGYTRTGLERQAQHQQRALIQHSNTNRNQLADAVRAVLQDNCNKGNGIRRVIRGILAQSIPNVAAQVKAGHLTPQEGRADVARIRKDIRLVVISNCAQTASPVH